MGSYFVFNCEIPHACAWQPSVRANRLLRWYRKLSSGKSSKEDLTFCSFAYECNSATLRIHTHQNGGTLLLLGFGVCLVRFFFTPLFPPPMSRNVPGNGKPPTQPNILMQPALVPKVDTHLQPPPFSLSPCFVSTPQTCAH